MIEINIRSRVVDFRDDVYIFERDGDLLRFFRFSENGNVIEETKSRAESYGAEIKPSFTAPHDIAMGIAQGFFDYLSKQGLASESQSYVKGKLEATEAHLKDTRKLLKLN